MTELDVKRLIELINDERARRARSEAQLAAQRYETTRWRRRARRAEMTAKLSIRLPSRKASSIAASVPALGPIAYPAIRAGVTGVPAWFERAVETVELAGLDEAGLAMLDVVVVGGELVPPELERWLRWPGRQPLIAFKPAGRLAELLATTVSDVVVGGNSVPARHMVSVDNPLEPSTLGSDSAAKPVMDRVRAGVERTTHSTAHQVLTASGIDLPDPVPSVTGVAVTKRPHSVAALVETLASMDVDRFHVALATHGFEISPQDRMKAEGVFSDRLTVRYLPEEWPLGRCLNHVIGSTTTDLWAKIDDDDYYGPLYLREAITEILTTGADLIGKQSHYLHDATIDKTFLMQPGNEYQLTDYVPGATFVGRRHAWEQVPFGHRHARVDSTFVRGMGALGLSIYSTSRFEFAVGRRSADGHTWHVSDAFYEARGRPVAEGFSRDTIFLPRAGSPADG